MEQLNCLGGLQQCRMILFFRLGEIMQGRPAGRERSAAMDKESDQYGAKCRKMLKHAMSSFQSITWWSTDFFRHVVGETERKRSNHVQQRLRALQWVSSGGILVVGLRQSRGMRSKAFCLSGWWCGVCGQPYDWRRPNGVLTLHIGDTAREQVVFPAHGAPGGECDTSVSAWEPVTNLMKGNKAGGGRAKSRRKQRTQTFLRC